MADVVSRYLSFLGAGTGEDIAGLFAADAVVEDPVGGQVLQGRDALTSFYSRVTAAENSAELLTMRMAGNSAAFHFRVVTTTEDQVITIEPIDVITFDDHGLITGLRAHWSAEDVHTVTR
ncbi:steroid delta-isomerase [Gordonia alkanivorans]|jgi:steroid delta-isomerase|uniref:nuclear transport factor 2 family protein n=1 Tax=Gordonia alkanivorans TaxID=84096 RepID=UPI000FDEBA15|nr:nuclear transport factor 2 family protein [Gordonia alkanivorans]AZZ83150.1 steroid delta-isomerase [Gordonia alkanivorans]